MIRKALPRDAPHLAQLVILAMDNLAHKFVSHPEHVVQLFEHFASIKANQYSYENMLVWDEGGIHGMVSGYDGTLLQQLRQPFLEYIQAVYGIALLPEDETQPGEYYIDCLAVFPQHQGKSTGKKLVTALAAYAATQGHGKLGLLVNKTNTRAQKFYAELGFQIIGERIFMGDVYHHLQLDCPKPARHLYP